VEGISELFSGFIKYVSVSYFRGKSQPDKNKSQGTDRKHRARRGQKRRKLCRILSFIIVFYPNLFSSNILRR